jgi:acyl-CoA thioester hydrolase
VLKGFRFVHELSVRFDDLDAFRHVNNAVFLTYLEAARIAYWLETTKRGGLDALDMIVARIEIDYRAPVFFGASLRIGVRCASMRRSSFVMEFRVEDVAAGALVAEAKKTLVHYDFAAARSAPLPPQIRQLLKERDPDLIEEA